MPEITTTFLSQIIDNDKNYQLTVTKDRDDGIDYLTIKFELNGLIKIMVIRDDGEILANEFK